MVRPKLVSPVVLSRSSTTKLLLASYLLLGESREKGDDYTVRAEQDLEQG
jgi:hypothetical protein